MNDTEELQRFAILPAEGWGFTRLLRQELAFAMSRLGPADLPAKLKTR
jgi:hypothetical protein